MKTIIEGYVKKLIDNVPPDPAGKIKIVDIILDGGIFNGSYQIGGLYFLKELENQCKIKIDKFSCCSVGALCALVYYINRLDLAIDFYDCAVTNFKKNKKLDFLHSWIDNVLTPLLPGDIYINATNKIYICYYNVKKKKKIVRQTYKSNKELLDCIKRSTFIPYFINGDALLDKRYIDGINPNIFKCEPGKKILYIDLLGIDKIAHAFSIKNEKTNFHRILAGILDIHLFFIKQSNTQMCSYVNDWSLYCWSKNKIIKHLVEKLIIYCLSLYIYLKKYIPEQLKDSLMCKICSNIFGLVIEHYCV
jgi:hypothetical protein